MPNVQVAVATVHMQAEVARVAMCVRVWTTRVCNLYRILFLINNGIINHLPKVMVQISPFLDDVSGSFGILPRM